MCPGTEDQPGAYYFINLLSVSVCLVFDLNVSCDRETAEAVFVYEVV